MSLHVEENADRGLLTRVYMKNRLLLVLTVTHLFAAIIACQILGEYFSFRAMTLVMMFVQILIPVFLILLWFWRFIWLIVAVRPEKPFDWFYNDIRGFVTDIERILSGLFAMLLVSIFASTFMVFKDLIPLINMFEWDPYFAALDRTLHGGIDPYALMLPLLGTPYVTTFINVIYHMWFVIFYFIIFMASFDRINTQRRNTFLIAFVLAWTIGGNILATVFSSVGPVYFQHFGYGDHFVPLLDMLNRFSEISPVWALGVHELLLDGYVSNGPMRGISAMPSLHVGIAVLLTLYGFQCSRLAGWALLVFTILIQLGSVHLAWHYAIDGYFGAIIAIFCWMISAKLVKRFG